jgi:hypothetical protein
MVAQQEVDDFAQARLAAAGEWALNEKGIVERAGLGDAARAFTDLDPSAAIDHITDLLAVEWV